MRRQESDLKKENDTMLHTFVRLLKPRLSDKRVMITFVLVFALSISMFWNIFLSEDNGLMDIGLQADSNEILQVYWAGKYQRYNEKRSQFIHIYPKIKYYKILLPDLKYITKLRIDPMKKPGKIRIKYIKIKQIKYKSVQFETPEELERLVALNDIQEIDRQQSGIVIIASGIDPQLEVNIKPEKSYVVFSMGIMAVFVIVISMPILVICFKKRIINYCHKILKQNFREKKIFLVWGLASITLGAFLIAVIPIQMPPYYKLLFFIIYSMGIGLLIFLVSFLLATRKFHNIEVVKVSQWSWLWYALPCFVVWTFYLLAFWPGSMSPDSLNQWKDGMSGHFSDWHPAFHTMNIWLITRLWSSPAAVAFAQIFALGLVAGWGLSIMNRLGVNKIVTWFVSFLFAISLVNSLMVITLWKDVAYSISVLALTLIVLKIIVTNGSWLKNRRSWLIFFVVIVLTALYRHNGIVAAFGTPIILIIFYRQLWRQITLAMLLGLIIFWGIRGPLYEVLDVDRARPSPRIVVKFPKSVGDGRTLVKKAKSALAEKNSSLTLERGLATLKYYTYSSSQIWRIKQLKGFFRRVEYANIWVDSKGKLRYINSNEFGIDESSIFPGVSKFLCRQLIRSLHSNFYFLLWRPAFYLYIFLASVAIASVRLKSWKLMLLCAPIVLHSIPFLVIQSSKAIFRYQYPVAVVSLLLFIPILFMGKMMTQTGNEDMEKN